MTAKKANHDLKIFDENFDDNFFDDNLVDDNF